MKYLDSFINFFLYVFSKKKNELKEDNREYYTGKRKIDLFRRNIIRFRKTNEIIENTIKFLKDFLETQKIGFYFWNENIGQFTDYINPDQKEIQIIDPIILILSEYDIIFLKKNLDLIRNLEHKKIISNLFEEKNANILIPLIMNESILGFIYANTNKQISISEYFTLEEFRYFVIITLSNSLIYSRLENLLKNLEERIKERTDELEKAQKTIIQQEKMAMLGTMVSGVAHELNTPIGVILASSDSILKYFELLIEVLFKKKDFQKLPEAFLNILYFFVYHLSTTETKIITKSFKLKSELKNYFNSHQIPYDEKLLQFLIEFKLYTGDSKTLMNPNNLFYTLIDYYNQCNEFQKKISLDILEYIALIYENIYRILYSSKNISKLVQSLRTYSRTAKNEFVNTNLNRIIDDTIHLLNHTIKDKVKIEKENFYQGSIECDANQIQQVLINLMMNSFQALLSTGKENPTIILKAKELNPEKIEIQVIDNGPGIPKEIQDQVWNPFFTTKPPGEGTGLGLGIAKSIIENHNGKIYFESNENGTTFFIELPKTQPKEKQPKKKHPSIEFGRYDWR